MSRLILIILLILGIIFSVILVSQKTSFFSKASPDIAPKQVIISNISDSGFTISWVTDKPTIGFIKYAKDASLDQTEYDSRDANGPKLRTTHYVILKNLSPSQSYFFKITSSDQVFGPPRQLAGGGGDKPYQQSTASVTEDTPLVPILTFGKLKKKDGGIPKEAIVYFKLSSGTTLSTFTSEEGNWLITATNIRKEDLSGYLSVKDGDEAQVWAEAGDGGSLSKTQIKVSDKQATADLNLEEPIVPTPAPDENVIDFNSDGVINALDYAIWVQRKLKL